MSEQETIELKDAITNEKAIIIVRIHEESVGLCISMETNGDVEVFLKSDDLELLVSALQRRQRTVP